MIEGLEAQKNEHRTEMLMQELVRTREVWNNFIHNLCHGFYPERTPGSRSLANFSGSDEDGLLEIFKIMDYEVRHIGNVLGKSGFDPTRFLSVEEAERIFDEVSAATGITETSHKQE